MALVVNFNSTFIILKQLTICSIWLSDDNKLLYVKNALATLNDSIAFDYRRETICQILFLFKPIINIKVIIPLQYLQFA